MKTHLFMVAGALGADSIERLHITLKIVMIVAVIVFHVLDFARKARRKKYPRAKKKNSVAVPLILLLGLLTSGCSSLHTAEVVKALAADTNSVSVKVHSTFGDLEYSRNK